MSLKPCPFCGGTVTTDHSVAFRKLSGDMGDAVAINCEKCSANMTMCCDDHPKYSPEDMMAIMTEAWNCRTRDAAP